MTGRRAPRQAWAGTEREFPINYRECRGRFFNFIADTQQFWPTNRLIDRLENITFGFPLRRQGINGTVEQSHQPAGR
jgi:hypothetical protein